MKLLLDTTLHATTARAITVALFRIDLGARINFCDVSGTVRIEGRITLDQAMDAIAGLGVPVAAVLDHRVVDTIREGRQCGTWAA